MANEVWRERALKAMQIFVERGEAALQLFARKEVEEGMSLLKSRGAAFTNFRFYDAKVGQDDESYREILQAWILRDAELRERLFVVVENAQREHHQELSQLRRAKDRLSQFKSHSPAEHVWEKSV